METSAAVVKKTDVDGEAFWKKLVLWLISNDKADCIEKQCIINLLREKNNFLTTDPSVSLDSKIHSHLGEIRFQMTPEDCPQRSHNKWHKVKSLPEDSTPVKPIVVEMNSSPGMKASVKNYVLPFYHQDQDASGDSEKDYDVDRKSRKGKCYSQKLRAKSSDRRRVRESTTSMSSFCEKKNKLVNSYSLKRPSFWRQLRVLNSTSGAFTVSSLPECDNESKLTQCTQSNDNCLRRCDVEIDGHKSCGKIHIATDHTHTSQSLSEIINTDMPNIIPSVNNSISNVTDFYYEKTTPLETMTALPKQSLSSFFSNSLEKRMQSVTIANNSVSGLREPGLLNETCNERLSKENVEIRFENTVNNYNVLEVPECANTCTSNTSFRWSERCLNEQPIAPHPSRKQCVRGSCSESLGTPESSQSSKASFHSCDTLVVMEAENINESLKGASNFPVEEQVTTCSDADDNCSPAKIRKLLQCVSHFSEVSSNVSSAEIADRDGDTTANNMISQRQISSSQNDILINNVIPADEREKSQSSVFRTQVGLAQNNNLREFNENFHQVGKNYRSNNGSCENNINCINEDCTQEEIAEVEDKNCSDHLFEENCHLDDKTIEERESQLSPLSINQTEDAPDKDIKAGNDNENDERDNENCKSDNESDESDNESDESDNESDESDNENDERDNENDERDNENDERDNENGESDHENDESDDDETNGHNCETYLCRDMISNTRDMTEKQMTQNIATSIELSSEESSSENNLIEIATKRLQSNKITSSCNLQGSFSHKFSQKPFSYITKTIISSNKSQESDLQNFHKSSKAGETKSCIKDIDKMSSKETLSYRKYCQFTIKELVALKPPPVEAEISVKNMIRDTVRAKRLLVPGKPNKLITEREATVSSQMSREEKAVQEQSFGNLDQSSPFCRQGMTGRRKIVLSSLASSNCEATAHTEHLENNSYSVITKKHQRIAHLPKKDAICNKRIIEETSCDEMPLSLKNSVHQANVSQRSCQKPPIKKTKLQKLKQKYVAQRRLVQTLSLDNNCLKPSAPLKPETGCSKQKTSEQNKSIELVNGCVSNHASPLEDIACDLMLSDSDESICEKNQKEKQCKHMCPDDFNKFLSSSKKEELKELNLEERNKERSNMTLQQLEYQTHKEGRNLQSKTNVYTPGAEILLGSVIHEQKSGNKDVCSSSKYCQINHPLESESTKKEYSEKEGTKEEEDKLVLESPLSPPDLHSESHNYIPITIPTSPVYTGFSENLDAVISENSDVIAQDNVLSQEVGIEGEADGAQLENSSISECDENNSKLKLRSWNKKLICKQKTCQEPNVLQEYFEHHYKKQKMNKKKTNKQQKLESKNYAAKKENIESILNAYLDKEFTEIALIEVIEDCKKTVQGDYRIIVKNVVKFCKYSWREKCDFSADFPLNPTQQRLFTLVMKLENDYPAIVDEVLERITLVLCNTKHHRYRPTLNCLARFFTAFCKMRNDKNRAQIFCYDALYCLKVRAHTVLYAVLTTFPECFPNAKNTAGNSLIVQAIVYCIFKYGDAEYLDTQKLRTFLSTYFCYQSEKLLSFENLDYFMKEIKGGLTPEVEQSILLLAKFKADWSWTFEKLVKDNLLKTVESWRKGHANENAAATCLKLCAYLAKSPPYGKPDVFNLMILFENLLFLETTPPVVKEACIFSLATLVQMRDRKVYAVLKKCKSEKYLENSKYLQDVLKMVLARRNIKWWCRFFQK